MKNLIEKEIYKEKIIKMIKEIENETYLKFIYNLLISFKEKWKV